MVIPVVNWTGAAEGRTRLEAVLRINRFRLYLVEVLAAIFLMSSFVLSAKAQEPRQIPDNLIDPDFLRERTWKSDPILENMVRDWATYEGEQGFEEKTVLKKAKIAVLESSFDAEYRVYKQEAAAEIAIIGNRFDGEFCPKLLEWTEARLGKPAKIIDLSSTAKERSFTDITADWMFGETRLQLSCGGLKLIRRVHPGAGGACLQAQRLSEGSGGSHLH